jgi:hypothetical protein
MHPLKPAISRRKFKVVCGLVYLVGFIAGYATYLPGTCWLGARQRELVVGPLPSWAPKIKTLNFFQTLRF